MKSIKRMLIFRLLLGLGAITILASVSFFIALRKTLQREFDAATLAKAKALASLIEVDGNGELEMDFTEEVLSEFSDGKSPEYFQLNRGKSILVRSQSLEKKDKKLRFVRGKLDDPRYRNIELPNGDAGRMVSLGFYPRSSDEDESLRAIVGAAKKNSDDGDRDDQPLTIIVARSREQLERMLYLLGVGCVLLTVCLPTAAVIVVAWGVRSGLKPLAGVATAAATINDRNLHRRFDASGVPAELRPICEKLNDLLARLSEAFDRERRFNRNVAHELRTPIAELRAITEVALMELGLDESAQAALREAFAISEQMEKLVNTLILLAQCELKESNAAMEQVDVVQILELVRADIRDHAAQSRIQFKTESDRVLTLSNPALLKIVLGNLFSNALEYSTPASKISVGLSRENGMVALTVENENKDLQAADVERFFEPFWRRDEARSGNAHAGLGLSIVSAICAKLGAELHAEKCGDAVRMTLSFPIDNGAARHA